MENNKYIKRLEKGQQRMKENQEKLNDSRRRVFSFLTLLWVSYSLPRAAEDENDSAADYPPAPSLRWEAPIGKSTSPNQPTAQPHSCCAVCNM